MPAKARKNYSVEALTNIANGVLANHSGPKSYREGIQNLIEHVLHSTGNYRGFRYLEKGEVPEGFYPGVRYENGEILPYPERFENTDNTRVYYFIA